MKQVVLGCLFLFVNSMCSLAAEPRFSGEPLPRFASLKANEVNTRVGPATTYPIKFVYKSKFQPVKIVNEYYGWYQIEDRNGDVSWVHKNYISKNLSAVSLYDGMKLYAKPKLTSKVVAKVNKDVIFKVTKCKKGFCEVKTYFDGDDFKGYVIKDNTWGVE